MTNIFPDGFPKDPWQAIDFSYFLTETEKQEWRSWLQGASPDQKIEFVDTLHAMWVENSQKAVPQGFNNQAPNYPSYPSNQGYAVAPNNQAQPSSPASNPSLNPSLNPGSSPIPDSGLNSTNNYNPGLSAIDDFSTNPVGSPPYTSYQAGVQSSSNIQGSNPQGYPNPNNNFGSPNNNPTNNQQSAPILDPFLEQKTDNKSKPSRDPSLAKPKNESENVKMFGQTKYDSNPLFSKGNPFLDMFEDTAEDDSENNGEDNTGDTSQDAIRDTTNDNKQKTDTSKIEFIEDTQPSQRANQNTAKSTRENQQPTKQPTKQQLENKKAKPNKKSIPKVDNPYLDQLDESDQLDQLDQLDRPTSNASQPKDSRKRNKPSENINPYEDKELDESTESIFEKVKNSRIRESLSDIYQDYLENQHKTFHSLPEYADSHSLFLDKVMQVVNSFGDILKYFDEISKKIIQINYKLVGLNTKISKTKTSSLNDIEDLRYQVSKLKSRISNLESDVYKNVQDLGRFRLDFREKTSKLEESGFQGVLNNPLKLEIDHLESRINLLETRSKNSATAFREQALEETKPNKPKLYREIQAKLQQPRQKSEQKSKQQAKEQLSEQLNEQLNEQKNRKADNLSRSQKNDSIFEAFDKPKTSTNLNKKETNSKETGTLDLTGVV
jgi:hypothetical protein